MNNLGTDAALNAQSDTELMVCPVCESLNSKQDINLNKYCCLNCNELLAYVSPNHTQHLKGFFDWLKQPGEILNNKYRINSLIGSGGFSSVYMCEDIALNNKKRVVKETPNYQYNENEAEILSKLTHPYLPVIIERFSTQSLTYIVMDFISDHTLENERTKQGGKVPMQLVKDWVSQLADVLSYLHKQDPIIIHRDLKPENILLDRKTNKIQLIDFGIASYTNIKEKNHDTVVIPITQGFSPPEQGLGGNPDSRSDVYAMAATAYILLSGKTPIAAYDRITGTQLDTLSDHPDSFPKQLDRVVKKGLSLNINDRYPTAEEFSAAFSEAIKKASPTLNDSSKPDKRGVIQYFKDKKYFQFHNKRTLLTIFSFTLVFISLYFFFSFSEKVQNQDAMGPKASTTVVQTEPPNSLSNQSTDNQSGKMTAMEALETGWKQRNTIEQVPPQAWNAPKEQKQYSKSHVPAQPFVQNEHKEQTKPIGNWNSTYSGSKQLD